MASPRVQLIQDRLKLAKDSTAQLNAWIIDKQASDNLLRLATNFLGDVETYLMPNGQKAENPANAEMWYTVAEFMLHNAEEHIRRVKDLVTKYGRNIQIVGGDSGSRFVPDRGIMGR